MQEGFLDEAELHRAGPGPFFCTWNCQRGFTGNLPKWEAMLSHTKARSLFLQIPLRGIRSGVESQDQMHT